MITKQKISLSWLIFTLLITGQPLSAATVPECQFTGQPTPEQIAACQAASTAQAQQAQSETTAPLPIPSAGTISAPPTAPTNTQADGPDLSAILSKLPPAPPAPENGPMPSFMGIDLAGNETAGAAAGQIGAALQKIRDGLLRSQEGLEEIKNGRIKIGADLETAVKNTQNYYDQAQNYFTAGKYAEAGEKLQEIKALQLEEKFNNLENQAISKDLIKNIKQEMESALKDLAKAPDEEETIEARAKVMAGLEKINQAETALKKNDKKTAAALMKSLRDSAPQDEAAGASGKIKGMSKKMMGKILEKARLGLARGAKGLARAKANGLEVSAEAEELLAKAQKLYEEAQALYDQEKYTEAATRLTELQKMDLEKKFSAYKRAMLPPERIKSLLEQVANGLKALDLTIEHAKAANYETSELEKIRAELSDIYEKTKTAADNKDTETFLTYLDEVDNLKISEKVDAIIKKLAQAEVKELVAKGLEKMESAKAALKEAINKLAAKKIATANAEALMADLEKILAKAKQLQSEGKVMEAGKALDQAIDTMVSLVNIARDSGVALAADRLQQINDVINIGAKAIPGEAPIAANKIKQLDDIYATVGQDEAMDLKQAFLQLDPELMDKVVAQRQKDKKFIDNILRDVMPLLPSGEREKIIEGKFGLLEELAATDRTINQIKRIKGVAATAPKALEQIKTQLKNYNFDPSIAASLEEKIKDFNDKLQSGELKDPQIISNYIKVLQEKTAEAVKVSLSTKLKKNLIPAKNIDDNHPLFDEIKYLKNDGAIAPAKNGEINLNQTLGSREVTDIINKTADQPIVKKKITANPKVADVAQAVLEAYNIKPNINQKNIGQLSAFFRQIGADIPLSSWQKKATLTEVAEIVAAADDRWGKIQ